jgi:RNA polymerase primary sigma factor
MSLDTPLAESDDSRLVDLMEDDGAECPHEIACERLRSRQLRRALDTLPPREREILELRFGLTGARPHTLEEVGRAFNVTRERIRQIEASRSRSSRSSRTSSR